MSYCRFSDGDVYLYANIYGGIECCACCLSHLVPTIYTKGAKELDLPDGFKNFMGVPDEPCSHCEGKGCEECMMHGSVTFFTRSEALEHLKWHIREGHTVPGYAISRLKEELNERGETDGIEIPDEPPSPLVQLSDDGPKRLSQEEAKELMEANEGDAGNE